MHRLLVCLAFSLVFVSTLHAQTFERRPMTTDDGLDLVQLGDVEMAPDGGLVFYSASELDWAKNKRKKTYFVISSDSGAAHQYIGEDGGSDFTFSPRGTFLSFKRSAAGGSGSSETSGDDESGKKSQIFLMRTAGGEAVQLTTHKESIGAYRWSDDETKLYFTSDDPRSEEAAKEHKNGADAFFVDEGPNGQDEGRWRNLWVVDVATKTITRLTNEPFRVGDFDVSPDGTLIVFEARYENRRNQGYLSELYLLNLTDSTHTRLTENEAPEDAPRWSPDGRSIAYLAPDDRTWELRNEKLWVIDPAAGDHRLLSQAFEGNIRGHVWSPDSRSILFTGTHRTNTNVYRLDVEDRRLDRLTDVTGTLGSASFSRDRSRMAFTLEDFSTSPDLFVSSTEDYAPRRLTRANPLVTDSLITAAMEIVRWTSADGLEIEGLLALPPGAASSGPLPFLLHIHGGPAGVFTNSFRYTHHVWAGLGYAQLFPNVRGSSGYSDELLRGNMQDIGGGDYQDLMTGVDAMIARGVADPERLAVRGWSYGGILGGWTVTQTDRFKAASLGAMVSDWTSEYGPGFNHDVRLWYIGGTPWDNPEGWRQRSALTFAENVTTPTLLIHGMSDPTDTEPQSMMFFAALKDMGKTVRYLRVPREPHGFREPRHQRARDVEEIRWIQRYTLGQEWSPWTRKAEKKATAEP